ncbi:MAG: hypothetical protein AAGH46_06275 [Bacteroidota bacterium]
MAPIKFEEEIKDKLEARRIEPSISSWDTLSDQLDKDKKGGKTRFWWLAIAASFLLILLTVIQVSKSPVEISPQDGFSVEESNELNVPVKAITEEKQPFDASKIELQEVVEVEKVREEKQSEPVVSSNSNTIIATKYEVAIVEKESTNEESLVNEESVAITNTLASNEIDKSLIQEVLQESKATSPKDIEKETDSLLKAAQKALILDKAMIENSTMVNAQDLLMEVEDEVEPSLKSKVYEVFKGGFKKVKTAVAQRKN